MVGFTERVVREYFELHGFLVRRLSLYKQASKKKPTGEEFNLLVQNPAYSQSHRTPEFMLFASELPYLHRAVVAAKGWDVQKLNPRLLTSSSEIFHFLEKNVWKTTEHLFSSQELECENSHELRKILVLPTLPTEEPHRSESIFRLRKHGVDGIISFRSMLREIINKIEVNIHYQNSEVLSILQLLKNCDMIKDTQMEFELGKPRGKG